MLTLLLWLYWSCAFWYTFWFKKEFEHQLVRHSQIPVSTPCTKICEVCLTLETDLVQNMIIWLNLTVPVFYVQTRIYLWLSQTIKFGLCQRHIVLTTLRLSQCTLCIKCKCYAGYGVDMMMLMKGTRTKNKGITMVSSIIAGTIKLIGFLWTTFLLLKTVKILLSDVYHT